jgi:hypothetical protein
LRTAAIGGTAAAAATLLSSSSALAAPAPASGIQYVKGVDVLPDTSHATSALVAHIRGYYQAKTGKNLDWQTSYFSRRGHRVLTRQRALGHGHEPTHSVAVASSTAER